MSRPNSTPLSLDEAATRLSQNEAFMSGVAHAMELSAQICARLDAQPAAQSQQKEEVKNDDATDMRIAA